MYGDVQEEYMSLSPQWRKITSNQNKVCFTHLLRPILFLVLFPQKHIYNLLIFDNLKNANGRVVRGGFAVNFGDHSHFHVTIS